MKDAIHWFDIPTADLDRATRFYEATLGVALQREVFGGVPHAIFPSQGEGEARGVSGALVPKAANAPGAAGVVIYLGAPDGVDACLGRARKAGAAEVTPTTSIGPHGWIAVFRDLDGNVIGLHAEAR